MCVYWECILVHLVVVDGLLLFKEVAISEREHWKLPTLGWIQLVLLLLQSFQFRWVSLHLAKCQFKAIIREFKYLYCIRFVGFIIAISYSNNRGVVLWISVTLGFKGKHEGVLLLCCLFLDIQTILSRVFTCVVSKNMGHQ